jgi:hypothetical protein
VALCKHSDVLLAVVCDNTNGSTVAYTSEWLTENVFAFYTGLNYLYTCVLSKVAYLNTACLPFCKISVNIYKSSRVQVATAS